MRASEIAPRPIRVVPKTDSVAATTLNDDHAQPPQRDAIRLARCIRLEWHLSEYRPAVQQHWNAMLREQPRIAVMKNESTGVLRRRTLRQHDVVPQAGAEAVVAFLEPEQARQRQPSVILPEIRLVILPPFLNLVAIRTISVFSGGQRHRNQQPPNVKENTDAHGRKFCRPV